MFTFLFAWTVFNNPGNKEVRATWNSRVLGLAMCTAGTSSIFFLIFKPTSSLEQSEKVRASVKPAWATASLNWSVNLFTGNC